MLELPYDRFRQAYKNTYMATLESVFGMYYSSTCTEYRSSICRIAEYYMPNNGVVHPCRLEYSGQNTTCIVAQPCSERDRNGVCNGRDTTFVVFSSCCRYARLIKFNTYLSGRTNGVILPLPKKTSVISSLRMPESGRPCRRTSDGCQR